MAKTPTDIRSLARSHTDSALKVLAGIMNEETAPAASRVAAASALLDRGWGKPKQETEITHKRIVASQLPDDELASIATGSSEGVDPAPIDPTQLN